MNTDETPIASPATAVLAGSCSESGENHAVLAACLAEAIGQRRVPKQRIRV